MNQDVESTHVLGRSLHCAAAIVGVAQVCGDDRTTPSAGHDLLLHLQRRPYRWVEFHNVSLKRGQRTRVEVQDELAAPPR